MRIYNYGLDVEGDRIYIAQNATQDPVSLDWTSDTPTKDSMLIEILDSSGNTGYISIKHANKTSGVITWTEIFRITNDSVIILGKVSSAPSAPSADQVKIYADLFLERIQAKIKTSSETLNLVQSDSIGRIWYSEDGSFPSGAKRGDILFKPA